MCADSSEREVKWFSVKLQYEAGVRFRNVKQGKGVVLRCSLRLTSQPQISETYKMSLIHNKLINYKPLITIYYLSLRICISQTLDIY